MPLKNNRGYTLIELVVVMGIFVVVMLVTSQGFKTVVNQVGQQSKSMETQIGSIIGLELLRSDLQNAGYGIPWVFQSTPSATEITTSDTGMPVTATFWGPGKSPITFNDAPGNPPHAVQSGDTTFNAVAGVGSKYLVIKSLLVAPGSSDSPAQKKWVTVSFSDSSKTVSQWGSADHNFKATDHVIVLRNTFIEGIPSRQLQVNQAAGGLFTDTFNHYSTLTQPHSSGDVFQVYGVDATTEPRMPFNRADYYVNRPANPPPACAPNTGILYKAVAKQSSAGGFTEMPLLDCVADMQVVYGIGPVGSDEVNLHQTDLPGSGSAKDIRERLKEIRVYILAHEGRKDTGFTYPAASIDVGEWFSGALQGRNFILSTNCPNWQNYRWKLYTIVVRPKNLIQ